MYLSPVLTLRLTLKDEEDEKGYGDIGAYHKQQEKGGKGKKQKNCILIKTSHSLAHSYLTVIYI